MSTQFSFLWRPSFSPLLCRAVVVAVALAWNDPVVADEIHDAAQSGDVAQVRALVKRKPNLVSSTDDQGQTPLHVAAANGRGPVVKLLLGRKAKVNARDNNGETPLHLAANKGSVPVVQLLLAYNANINAKDTNGDTPLHLAAASGRKATAELLLANNADIKARNNAGDTPAQVAAKHRHKDMVDMLAGRFDAYGTGFFITDNGYLVSNYHVINGAVKVSVVTGTGTNDAKVVQVDPTNDLALLKVDGKFAPLPVSPSAGVMLGSTVATVGFPDPDLQGFSPKLSKGEIASLSGIQDDTRYFQISVPVQPGNSGGPLVNEHGNVVGVVSAKLSFWAALMATGEIPENVNYAVKSGLILDFLKPLPSVLARLKPVSTATRTFPDVVQSVQAATVLIHANIEMANMTPPNDLHKP